MQSTYNLKLQCQVMYMKCMYMYVYVCICMYMCIYLYLTVVNCGNLTNPVNGQVTHTAGTTLGQTATYSCNTGYNLVGNSTRTCLATGVWSGNVPTCQSMLHPAQWVTLHNI